MLQGVGYGSLLTLVCTALHNGVKLQARSVALQSVLLLPLVSFSVCLSDIGKGTCGRRVACG